MMMMNDDDDDDGDGDECDSDPILIIHRLNIVSAISYSSSSL
jgi:hypothetical protein